MSKSRLSHKSYILNLPAQAGHKSGYTLIELLITVTLTAMLITFGVSAYRLAADRQVIKSETELILSTLTQAQKAATSGKADCSGPYLGERVQVTAGNKTLNVQSICSQDPQGTIRTYTLTRATFTDNHTLVFQPLNQGVDVGAGLSSLNLDYDNDSTTYRIEITRSGSIKPLGAI